MKRIFSFFVFTFSLQMLFAQNSPVAANDAYTTNKNNLLFLFVLANDYDLDGDPLTVSLLVPSLHGTSVSTGTGFNYSPAFNYVGTDSFKYLVCDTTSRCDTATVIISISGINNAPVANSDMFAVSENSVTFLPVTANDYDPDGDPLAITILIGAQHGTTTVTNGTQVIYTPTPFYFGTDSFSYILCDTFGLCDTAWVYVNINGTNAHPVAVDDNFSFGDTLNTSSLDMLANDYDVENDSFFVVSVIDIDSNNNLGTLTITPTGEVVFARVPLACGSETFEYVICQIGGCDTGLVTISITCPDNIFLPQGFSPDGDGMNDKLVFTGLEYFAPASLKIYNRYGTLVYENAEYQNDWGGTNMDSDKGLPDGTYFYVLQLSDKRKYNSYLIINR